MSRHLPFALLSRLADGALDPISESPARAHLAQCLPCRNRWATLLRVRNDLRSLPPLEDNPLQQLQPPVFIPVVRPAFPRWGFASGAVLGILLATAWVALQPRLPMRVVSTLPVAGVSPWDSAQLQPGEALHLPDPPAPGEIDLEIPNQIALRLKPGTTISWQEADRLWLFGGRPNIVLNVMRGEVMARTHDGFWGSRLQVRTPTANATVKGTAFSVQVEPERDATTLQVLAGEVFFSPYLDPVGVNVRAGEEGRIEGRRFTEKRRPLSREEKKRLLETYRIGSAPARACLVIGGGPERVEELLQPALLHLTLQPHPQVHPFVVMLVQQINAAVLEENLASRLKALRNLETALQGISDPELAVPLRLYIAACNARLGYRARAEIHFRWVAEQAPQHPLASLALAAWGTPEALEKIRTQYPQSPESSVARRRLEALRSPSTRGI